MNTLQRLRHAFAATLLTALAMTPLAIAEDASQMLLTSQVTGGVVIHVGCGDGKLAVALCAGDSYVVEGLDSNSDNIAAARKTIAAAGLAGRVTARQLRSNALPYVDNFANLIIAEDLGDISIEDVMRVLAPGAVAHIKQDGKWSKRVKPRPAAIDEWTHYLHDAGGNAVAADQLIGPPRHTQWVAEPDWTRNHHTLASVSSVVTTEGRIFYIVDEGPASNMDVPGDWYLVARDAFNGTFLFKRNIKAWAWHLRKFRSGPVQLPRTLVAKGDRVYIPLGVEEPLTALDAATGKTVTMYEGTRGTEEVILSGKTLLAVVGVPAAEHSIGPDSQISSAYPNEKAIIAFDADTAKVLWKFSDAEGPDIIPVTLVADDSRACFQAGKEVICLNLKDGEQIWRRTATASLQADSGAERVRKNPNPKKKPASSRSAGWAVATVVLHDGVVLSASGSKLTAFAARDGEQLWQCEAKAGFKSPADVFVVNGLVFNSPGFAQGRDLHTGQVKKENIDIADLWTAGHHHRCYREKATDKFLLTSYRGIEFVDLTGDEHSRNNWIRGVCQYGIMPANGLIYTPPHTCACYIEAKLFGFWAVAPQRKLPAPDNRRLIKGSAYGWSRKDSSSAGGNGWPMHRRNSLRNASTTMQISTPLKNAWQTEIGGPITAPVIAAGKVVVSQIDTHEVVALRADDGQRVWSYTTGGRVDSPPALHKGLAIFGCADGYIYCLRLRDGAELWRFRAAPADLMTIAGNQMESVWPVHGSILIQNDIAYAAAGRSSYLDGGIALYGLDPQTGKILHEAAVESGQAEEWQWTESDRESDPFAESISQNKTDVKTFKAPDKSDAFSMEGATTDLLSGDGESIYMRHMRFDNNLTRRSKRGVHIFSTTHLLDDTEIHRSHIVLGGGDFSRLPVAYSWVANSTTRQGYHLAQPYGTNLAFDDKTIWGVRRQKKYTLFTQDRSLADGDETGLDFAKVQDKPLPKWPWSTELAMRPRAIVRTADKLVLAGMPLTDGQPDLAEAFAGLRGGVIRIFSTADGKKIDEHKLASPPVWDGVAAAYRRLFISTTDGTVVCVDASAAGPR